MSWQAKPGGRAMLPTGDNETTPCAIIEAKPDGLAVVVRTDTGNHVYLATSALTPPPEWDVIEAARDVARTLESWRETTRDHERNGRGRCAADAARRKHTDAVDKLRAALARHDEVEK